MISFLIHAAFISFIVLVLLSIIHIHERDARMMRLLTFLVVAAGGAAIVHRLLVLYGIDF
jgi:hypothetical protein